MATVDADRNVDLAHHYRLSVAHVPRVALDQIGTGVATCSETCRVIEYAAVARVGSIESDVTGFLRLGIDLVVNRQVAVAIDTDAERQAIVAGEKCFLKFGQRAIAPFEAPALARALGAFFDGLVR